MEDGECWFGGGGGGRLDGLSGILGGGCDLVMVRVGEGLEKRLWGKLGEAGQDGVRDGGNGDG